jgi:hypothetical protein
MLFLGRHQLLGQQRFEQAADVGELGQARLRPVTERNNASTLATIRRCSANGGSGNR